MAVFISYSSQDRAALEALHTALKRAQQQVWFDQELGGGDAWWSAILEQIRNCEVFIVALSNNWLQSKPSQAELRYAQALRRPILPVRVGPVDSVRVNPVATLQIIDYQNPTVDAGIQLVTAIHALRAKAEPLPSPLPEEPPVPFGYITRLGNDLAEKELSPQQQIQLLVELRSGFAEDGDDPSARSDIAQLLRMLRLRHDVTYRTRTEIDNVLKEIEAKDAEAAAKTAESSAKTQAAIPVATAPSAQPGAGTSPRPPAAQPAPSSPSQGGGGGKSNKKLLVLGAAALAVIVAIVLVVVFTSQKGGGERKPAAQPAGAAAPVGEPSSGGGSPARAGLLGAEELGTLVGDPNLGPHGRGDALRNLQATSSIPDCVGTFEVLAQEVYEPYGPTAGRWEEFRTRDSETGHRIVEATATFPSAEKARAFVEESGNKWRACANQTVTYTSGKAADWNVADVAGEPGNITQLRTQANGAGRTCQHALRAASDVVIEVQACGPDITDAAARIADQIATRAAK
ncbi:sensor domain-containing protein [Mycobacterium intermedium]|uniref:sensor domain-containing protein n=1 Tax=Mycobacterium intermedium TaxID=28445 RepID=UPI0008496CA2|nr:sensor domain-containing protein [Mycobacterium intermedium]MCV6966508.1 sensor domain-containing protein [Mycobacterium intermedium]ODQ97656.1 hypothetical protein BHQ20_25920 [Mycobacterium intermedium]